MTIQGTLLNALSSLAAEQRQSAVIANNVANANTAGYVRRELPRSERITAGQGNGVDTGATQRIADEALAAAARASSGDAAYGQKMADALKALTDIVGQASDGRSLSSALGGFRSAMTALSAAPDNAVAQSQAVEAAKTLTDAFHRMDAAVTQARTDADLGISRDVDAVNATLAELDRVDRGLGKAAAGGDSLAELQDRRDLLLADLSKALPVRVYDGGPGSLIVTTDRGQTLYDSGTVHKLTFTHSANVTSGVRAGTGLSTVQVDGRTLRTSETGTIAAGLQLRDVTLTRHADGLDEMAKNLMSASQQSDTSIRDATPPYAIQIDPSGGLKAGLFTKGVATGWDPTLPATGLAAAISVHVGVDPERGGNASRMRDGVAATVPATGNASDNTHILSLLDAIDATATYTSATGLPSTLSLSDAAAQSTGLLQADRGGWSQRAEMRRALDTEAQQSLSNKTGVNVDEELQRLLLVQQTHAASVQVIQAASKMLDDLLSLRS